MSAKSMPNQPHATVVEKSTIWKVIIASALGTMIEWYDFYIFRKPRHRHCCQLLPQRR